MIAHHVLFWVKSTASIEDLAGFKNALAKLKDIESVSYFHLGTPSAIQREVVVSNYTFSLLIMFDDMAGHDIYQSHALHQAFLAEYKSLFEKVVIYDAE